MKKLYCILPLMASLSLIGCSTSQSSGGSEANAGVTESMPSWQPSSADFQSNMPNSMPTPQPTYTPPSVPAATTYGSAQNEVRGNCTIVRDGAGTPVYASMTKGCYTENSYTVGAQDTLYLIAFLAGKTPSEIAALNNITTSTKLKIGQSLRVR